MQIGELAKRFGVTAETIRYYEREGLIQKARRTAGNYRVYDELHATQLSFILNCRSLDMSQDEIRKLLAVRRAPSQNCRDVNELIDGHIQQVTQRIRDLKDLLGDLNALRKSCNDARTIQHCEILNALSRSSTKRARGKKVAHSPATRKGSEAAESRSSNPSARPRARLT